MLCDFHVSFERDVPLCHLIRSILTEKPIKIVTDLHAFPLCPEHFQVKTVIKF